MTRTVFDNHMVAHVWAQQTQSEGRSHNGNFSFRDSTLYSYSTPIARFTKDKKGRKVLLVTSESYSITTSSKHMPALHRAIPYRPEERDYKVFYVRHIGGRSWAMAEPNHESNLADLLKAARDLLAKAGTLRFESWQAETINADREARGPHYLAGPVPGERRAALPSDCDLATGIVPRFLDAARQQFETAADYAATFGLKAPTPKAVRKELESALAHWRTRFEKFNTPQAIKRREQAAAARVRKREAAERAERERMARTYAEAFARWKRGEGGRPSSYHYEPDSPERIEIEAAEQADREQAQREAGEAFRLWQAGEAPRPSSWNQINRLTAEQRAILDADVAREREAEERATREAWLRGEAVYFRGRLPDGSAYVRAVGDTLETSLGATVPLAHAIRAYRFIKAVRAKGEAWQRNGQSVRVGHFQLDAIEADGSFRAGCHRFAWGEIERLALALGVADLAPSSEAVESSAR